MATNFNSISFLFNLQKRIDLLSKDWPDSIAKGFVPLKASLLRTGLDFSFYKIDSSLLKGAVNVDPSDKAAYAAEYTALLDNLVYSLEHIFCSRLPSNIDASVLVTARKNSNVWGNNCFLGTNSSVNIDPTGIPVVHLLYDFTPVFVVSLNSTDKVMLTFTVDAFNNISSAYIIVQ